jgi:hypothetical protein
MSRMVGRMILEQRAGRSSLKNGNLRSGLPALRVAIP